MLMFRMKMLPKENLILKTKGNSVFSTRGIAALFLLIFSSYTNASSAIADEFDKKNPAQLRAMAINYKKNAEKLQEQLLAARSVPSAVAAEVPGDIQRQYDELKSQIDLFFYFSKLEKAVQQDGKLYQHFTLVNQLIGVTDTPTRSDFLTKVRAAIEKNTSKVEDLTPKALDFTEMVDEVALSRSRFMDFIDNALEEYVDRDTADVGHVSHFLQTATVTHKIERRDTLTVSFGGTVVQTVTREQTQKSSVQVDVGQIALLQEQTDPLANLISTHSGSLTQYRGQLARDLSETTENVVDEIKGQVHEIVYGQQSKKRQKRPKKTRTSHQNNNALLDSFPEFIEGRPVANAVLSFLSCLARVDAQPQLENGSANRASPRAPSVQQITDSQDEI